MSRLQELLGDAYKDGMTVEEIDAALETAGITKRDPNAETAAEKRWKDALDKATSEAAKYKKQVRDQMDEASRIAAETNDRLEALETENAELKKIRTIAENKANYIALGFDEALAADTAQALYDGDMNKVFANTKAFSALQEQKIKAAMMKGTPVPPAGDGATVMTREKFDSLSTLDQQKFIQEHPNWKKELHII